MVKQFLLYQAVQERVGNTLCLSYTLLLQTIIILNKSSHSILQVTRFHWAAFLLLFFVRLDPDIELTSNQLLSFSLDSYQIPILGMDESRTLSFITKSQTKARLQQNPLLVKWRYSASSLIPQAIWQIYGRMKRMLSLFRCVPVLGVVLWVKQFISPS